MLLEPSTSTLRVLAPSPPPALLERLTEHHVPVSVGHGIVATVVPHDRLLLQAIRDLGVDWHLIFNKGSVMALPSGVTKATGLAPALEELHITADQTVAVGDAENDVPFLKACGLAVAVANALPAVKEMADVVTAGERGAGVAELIDRMLAGDLDAVLAESRNTA